MNGEGLMKSKMADEKDQAKPNQLNIEISEEVADGIYSNLTRYFGEAL